MAIEAPRGNIPAFRPPVHESGQLPQAEFMTPEHFTEFVRDHIAGILFDTGTLETGNAQPVGETPYEFDVNRMIAEGRNTYLTPTSPDTKWLISVNPRIGSRGIAHAFLTQLPVIERSIIEVSGPEITFSEYRRITERTEAKKAAAASFYEANRDLVDQEMLRLREAHDTPSAPAYSLNKGN